jgi:hypothetical protein
MTLPNLESMAFCGVSGTSGTAGANPVRLPILHVTCPAARSAVRSKRRMGVGLLGYDLLLNLRQQELPFDQRQT